MPRLFRAQFDLSHPENYLKYVEQDGSASLPALVETLTSEALPFAFYTTGGILPPPLPSDCTIYDCDIRAIIGYGGKKTFPFISDPTDKIAGAVGIKDRKLVYSIRGCALHTMRDKYTYDFGPDDRKFYTDWDFFGILKEFLSAGYELALSSDMRDYRLEYPLTIVSGITLEDIQFLSDQKRDYFLRQQNMK